MEVPRVTKLPRNRCKKAQRRELQRNSHSEKASPQQTTGLGSGETRVLSPAEEEITFSNVAMAALISRVVV